MGKRVPASIEKVAPEPVRVQKNVGPGFCVPLSSLPEEHEAILYLKRRGFDPLQLERTFGISYCKSGVKFARGLFDTTGTIMIPIMENGSAVAWQSRLLYDPSKVKPGEESAYGWLYDAEKKAYKEPPKYFTSPGFKKGEHFFNFDNASKFGFTVVTEGAFDAMRVGPCSVAAFGKGVTDTQIEILRAKWPVVILLLDPDAEADQEKLRMKLEGRNCFGGAKTSGTTVVTVRLHGYKDAGECPHSEVVRQIVLSALSEGVDLGKICKKNPFS
jgi:hypothetical protein